MPRILFVFSSASKTLQGKPTGWYLPEAAHPYYVLSPHVDIDFTSLKGPNPPLDPVSVEAFKQDDLSVKFLQDPTVKTKFDTAKKLADVSADDYDAIFYIGGHGPVIDLPTDPVNIKLASSFWAANKITAAICHGPAVLKEVKDPSGKYILSGRRATALSNEEEKLLDGLKAIPFLPEDMINERGGKYEKASEPFGVKVVVDGKLITGQNPASAQEMAEVILKALNAA